MTSSGGKTGRAPGTRKVIQALESFLEEAFAPLADDLTWERDARGDLVITESLRGHEDGFSSNNLEIR